ncbi:MAG: hypothetical protein PHO08_20585 [Methylococcales bacterium]|nr:hypothetical protein [Methylococcales bacterium]
MGSEVGSEGGSNLSYIIVAIIAFGLGLDDGNLWAAKKAPTVLENKATGNTIYGVTPVTGDKTSEETTPTGPRGAMIARNAIIVCNQLADINLKISQMCLEQVSWVVVREDDGAGAPGSILGAQLFDTSATNGAVKLLRSMTIGKTYFAIIYIDNGDHAFDPKLDSPLLDNDGKPRMAIFKATDASGDQTGTPTNI